MAESPSRATFLRTQWAAEQTKREVERTWEDRRVKGVGSATGEWAFTAEPNIDPDIAHLAMTKFKTSLEKLRTLNGSAFDREFVRTVLDDHQMVIDRVTNARKRITDPEVRERRRSITYARTAGLSMCASRRRTSPSSTALFHGRSSPGLPSCADTRVMLEYLQRGPKRLGGHANTRLHALTCMSVSPRCASLPIAVSPPGSHRGTRARPQRSTVPR
jgi:hypothetical protein